MTVVSSGISKLDNRNYMNKSESIKELATALAKAQGEIKGAVKDSSNPFFNSKYADLTSVVEAIRSAFSKNGLSYVQTVEPSEKSEVRVSTTILHASGEWFDSGILALPVAKADAQGYGSALTYARRYSLSAAVGVAPEDDDGNAAAGTKDKHGTGVIKPSDGVETRIAPARREALERVASSIVDCLDNDQPKEAVKAADALTDPDEKVFVWEKLDSRQRSLIKRTKQEMALAA